MTIQVGVIGTDGIVLASDKVFTRLAGNDGEFDDQVLGRKIVEVSRHELVYAFAGDWFSEDLGAALVEAMDRGEFNFLDIYGAARKVLWERYAGGKPMPREIIPRSVLLLFYGSKGVQLWKIAVERDTAYPVLVTEGSVVSGAFGNSARFFQSYSQSNLPVERLKFFAAHLVCAAGRNDPQFIKGLEIVTADRTGLRWETQEEISNLQEKSLMLDKKIAAELFDV